jgi:MFS family permease
MVADMWEANEQQYAVAFLVFTSVGGGVLGPVIGGFAEYYLNWRWCTWIQLIAGIFVQIIHASCVPETRTAICLDQIARKKRECGESPNVYGPNERKKLKERFPPKEILLHTLRPFAMFYKEPIVLILSLLSGFADALIFMFIQSFEIVYKKWDFDAIQIGLAFTPILIGYFVAWASWVPAIKRNMAEREKKPDDQRAQYEARLYWLLYLAPTLPIGLLIFAFTSVAPHWIGTMVGSFFIGIANYAVYMATIDYMVCAYGQFAASATGGNGFARDFLAGALTVPAAPFFIGKTSSS